MNSIKLYGYATSPFVRKVGCCLHYKGLPFEFIPVNPIDPREIAFTCQTQVPVLQIDDEWRKDSTQLALWLDSKFPEKPLFGRSAAEREQILDLDQWVTSQLLLSGFRAVAESELTSKFRSFAWRLAAIVSSQTPLSDEVRSAWPEVLKMTPFIHHMMADVDSSEDLRSMQRRVVVELIMHLGEGPYFGGLAQPSLVDMAIFPQLVFTYMVGLKDKLEVDQAPALLDWVKRMVPLLPENPLLVRDFIIVNKLT